MEDSNLNYGMRGYIKLKVNESIGEKIRKGGNILYSLRRRIWAVKSPESSDRVGYAYACLFTKEFANYCCGIQEARPIMKPPTKLVAKNVFVVQNFPT